MILHGDLFDVLPTLEAERFHACVTDPPYGIGFMGREWDTFSPEAAAKKQGLRQLDKSPTWRDGDRRLINPNLKGRTVNGAISSSQIEYDRSLSGLRGFQAWTESWAREVFRVLKPGAHLVVCGAPRSHHRMMSGLEDAGFEIRDCLAWLFGQGFPKSRNLGHGWGTALKPAHEPIALARKPFAISTQACRAAYGTAGLNIDGCRIDGHSGTAERRLYGFSPNTERAADSEASGRLRDRSDPAKKAAPHPSDTLGRWPANVVLDEEAAALLDEQSGELKSGTAVGGLHRMSNKSANVYGHFKGERTEGDVCYGDSGGASRFFYVAKPSREERDLAVDHLPRKNFHPTVKPLALMRWLVKLVTPLGGCVLDPFGGSGTTGMACAAEGVDFVLIEREAEYIPILERRIRAIAPLFTETA